MAVGGVIVTLATLHNEDEIRRKALSAGALVIVKRAGTLCPHDSIRNSNLSPCKRRLYDGGGRNTLVKGAGENEDVRSGR